MRFFVAILLVLVLATAPASEPTTKNEKIAEAAWAIITAEITIQNIKRGYCLMGVRLIVEHALGWNPYEFYDHYGVTRTSFPGVRNGTWWASDIEASMKVLGYNIPHEDIIPGDLVFNHNIAKPQGHVAIYMGDGLILEVTDPRYRVCSLRRGDLCITTYEQWSPTLVARLR